MHDAPANDAPHRIIVDCRFGEATAVYSFTNLYGCEVGDRSRIGTFVEIQAGVVVGADCKVQSHSFLCTGVRLADRVFVGHGVMFTNDKHPRATNPDGSSQGPDDWECLETIVEEGASIGSAAVILGGVRIGARATVGAGAVVVRDVQPGTTVVGNPARALEAGRA